MKKGVVMILFSLVFVSALILFILPKTNFITGFTIHPLDASHLEELRLKAEVECLQNSQCQNGSECIGNVCVDKKEIDLCQDFKLYSGARKLEIGQPINSIKSVITDGQLPYLLPDGELVEIINNEIVEYFYVQTIFIGENKIEKETEDYIIEKDEPLYTYRLTFSRGVDFSNKNIQGQTLRILGEEYAIGSNSDNSNIYLVSEKRNIKLQDEGNLKIVKDEKGNIIIIEIEFFSQDKLKTNENFTEPTFDAVKLSFNSAGVNFADVRVGGNC